MSPYRDSLKTNWRDSSLCPDPDTSPRLRCWVGAQATVARIRFARVAVTGDIKFVLHNSPPTAQVVFPKQWREALRTLTMTATA